MEYIWCMDEQTRAELQGRAMRELSIAHQLAETRLNRALRPLGLTMTHTAVLLHLANAGPGSVGDIAAAMEVNQPAVSKTLKTLVTYSGRGIKKGDTFAAVKAVQKTVGAKQSGKWSSASVKKLKAFQRRHDLDDTGKLSYATWRALEQAAWPR